MIARRKEHVSRVGPKAGDAEAVGLPAGDGVEAPEGLTADGADRLIRSHREEWGKLPPTLGQENYLRLIRATAVPAPPRTPAHPPPGESRIP